MMLGQWSPVPETRGLAKLVNILFGLEVRYLVHMVSGSRVVEKRRFLVIYSPVHHQMLVDRTAKWSRPAQTSSSVRVAGSEYARQEDRWGFFQRIPLLCGQTRR